MKKFHLIIGIALLAINININSRDGCGDGWTKIRMMNCDCSDRTSSVIIDASVEGVSFHYSTSPPLECGHHYDYCTKASFDSKWKHKVNFYSPYTRGSDDNNGWSHSTKKLGNGLTIYAYDVKKGLSTIKWGNGIGNDCGDRIN